MENNLEMGKPPDKIMSRGIYLDLILLLLTGEIVSGRHLKLASIVKINDIRPLNRSVDISLTLRLCNRVNLRVHPRHECCSGIVLPRKNPKYMCCDGKPYKRTKTKTRCDEKTLVNSRHSKKYGCCGKWKYKKSQLFCSSSSTYRPLKIPCHKGFEPKPVRPFVPDTKPRIECFQCSAGTFSSHFGRRSCQKCSECEHGGVACSPTQNSVCKPPSSLNSTCTGEACRGQKIDLPKRNGGKRIHRRKHRKNHKNTVVFNVSAGAKIDNSSKIFPTNFGRFPSIDSHILSLEPSSTEAPQTTTEEGIFAKFSSHESSVTVPPPPPKYSPAPPPAYDNGVNVSIEESTDPFKFPKLIETEVNDSSHVPIINFEENEPIPAAHVRFTVVLGVAVSFLITGIIGVIILRKMARRSLVKDDIERRDHLSKGLGHRQSIYDSFVDYQDEPSKVNKMKELKLNHPIGLHRRSKSDSVIILACSRDRLSFQLFEGPEGMRMRKRAQIDTLSLDAKHFSNEYCSSLSTPYSQRLLAKDAPILPLSIVSPGNILGRSCSLTSFEYIFSTLAKNVLEIPTFLPQLIKNIEKSPAFDDTNITDSLFKEKFTQTSLKKSNQRNLLGDGWDRGGSFDQDGGTLDKIGSAVSLVIPRGAVDAGNVAKVHGKVFTNLSQLNPVFRLQKGERFISPIVEFVESNGVIFRKHMIVKIPISPGCGQDSSLKVYCVPGNGDLSVSSIPRIDKHGNKPDVYYDVEEHGFVFVYTKHFTAFACSSCNRTQIQLNGLIMRKIQETESCLSQNFLSLDITLRLYICDSLCLIKDFRTELEKRDAGQGWQRDVEKPISLGRSSHENDELTMTVTLQDGSKNNWEERKRSNGLPWILDNGNKKLYDLTSCDSQKEYPEIGGEWVFSSKGLSQTFMCTVDVEHVPTSEQNGNTNTSQGKITTLSVIIGKLSFPNQSVQQKHNTDDIYIRLAKELNMSDARPFARLMGVGDTTIEELFSDFSGDGHECKYRVIQKSMQTLGPVVFREKLPTTLQYIGRLDVAQKLFCTDVFVGNCISSGMVTPATVIQSDV